MNRLRTYISLKRYIVVKNGMILLRKTRAKLRFGDTTKNIATLITGNSVAQLVNLAGIPILSRIYDPVTVGLLAIYISVAAIFSVISAGRYELAIVLPEDRHEAVKIKALSQWIVISISIAAFIFLLILMDPISSLMGLEEYRRWLPAISLLIFLSGFNSILNYWYTRQKDFKIQSINKVILSSCVLGLQICLGLFVSSGFPSLLTGVLLGQTIALMFLVSQQKLDLSQQQLQVSEVKKLLRKYKKMPLVNGPNALVDSMRVNGLNFLIASISTSSLGQFNMALRGVQAPVGLIAQALSQVFLQKMASEKKGHLYPTVVAIIRRGLLLASVPFSILFIISPQLFPILLGPGWELSGYFAQALIPWLFLNVVTSPLASLFLVTQTQGRLLVFALFYMAVPLLVVYWLREEILLAVWGVGLSMAGMLLIQITLAIFTARQADLKHRES